MSSLFSHAVRWPAGRTRTLASSAHQLRRVQDNLCLWRQATLVRAVSARKMMAFENLRTSSILGRSSMIAQLFSAKLALLTLLVNRSSRGAAPFFFAHCPGSIALNHNLAAFSSTRTPLALRNTYYAQPRGATPNRYVGRSDGGFGGSGGRGGSNFWGRFKAAINALPQNVLVWGIIGANAIVFLGWQYAEQTYVRVTICWLLPPPIPPCRDSSVIQNYYHGCSTTSLQAGRTCNKVRFVGNAHNDYFHVLNEPPNIRSYVSFFFKQLREHPRTGRCILIYSWTLVTSCFSHSTSGHIIMNLVTFYFFVSLALQFCVYCNNKSHIHYNSYEGTTWCINARQCAVPCPVSWWRHRFERDKLIMESSLA